MIAASSRFIHEASSYLRFRVPGVLFRNMCSQLQTGLVKFGRKRLAHWMVASMQGPSTAAEERTSILFQTQQRGQHGSVTRRSSRLLTTIMLIDLSIPFPQLVQNIRFTVAASFFSLCCETVASWATCRSKYDSTSAKLSGPKCYLRTKKDRRLSP